MGAAGKEEEEEPAVGIPYVAHGVPLLPNFSYGSQGGAPEYPVMAPPLQWDFIENSEQQRGGMPSNAITQNLRGLPLRETFYGDTPAPFECIFCGHGGMTDVRSTLSAPAWVACAVTVVGCCFLCKDNCFLHKYHHCPNCGLEVAVFRKTDLCMFADPKSWHKPSYALLA